MERTSVRRRATVPLTIAALALLGSACGSSSNDQGSTPPGSAGVQQDQVIKDDSKPRTGGNLRYGVEAETDGLNPVKNRWAISGTLIGMTVYDPLAAYDDKGAVKPYLAEAFDHNAGYTEWTIRLRSGVTFHNGTKLTADAVKQVLEGHLSSPLTKPVFSLVDKLEVTGDLTLKVTMKGPWSAFPTALTSQAGVVPEPSTLSGDGSQAIGTGPFKQVSWEKNQSWKGAKYASYWRKDKDGVQLPYLDSVEFRPIAEQATRDAAVTSGELDMEHTDNPQSIKKFREMAKDGKIQIVEDKGESEEGFIILNSSKAPFDDVNLRRALAYATDAKAYNDAIDEGVPEVADGVFSPRSPWYSPTPDYPTFDLAKATDLVNQWKAAHGGQAPEFTLQTAQNAENQRAAEFWKAQWEQAGFKVNIVQVDQAKLIADAVGGNYQANIWRQFGSPDPDFDYIWWTSENADGALALNIARHKDPCVDDALKRGRSTDNVAERKKAYADLQTCFAKDVPYVWYNHTLWAIVAGMKVRGITNGPLPDGTPSMPIGAVGDFGGIARLTMTWLAA